jgi:hypothetical protein
MRGYCPFIRPYFLICPAQRKEFKDALDLFESALRSHKVKYGDIHHLVGTGLHNCGIVHMLAEQYIQGKMCFQEAVSVRSAALGESHPDVAVSAVWFCMAF